MEQKHLKDLLLDKQLTIDRINEDYGYIDKQCKEHRITIGKDLNKIIEKDQWIHQLKGQIDQFIGEASSGIQFTFEVNPVYSNSNLGAERLVRMKS